MNPVPTVAKRPWKLLPESVRQPIRQSVADSQRRHVWSRLIRESLFHRRLYSPKSEREIVDAFHRLYYDSYLITGTWQNTFWMGRPLSKCPFDLWIYQELLVEQQPEYVIECGTANGGSALFLACICDLIGHGTVITVDVAEQGYAPPYSEGRDLERPEHHRIEYVIGSSLDPAWLDEIAERTANSESVLVILDSNHSRDHVLAELRAYGDIVKPGNYIVVEDTDMNGHPILPDYGPGPYEAVQAFLAERSDFEADRSREKFYMTQNPSGYLRKRSD
jgi:cephalosporin hydroxylase